MKKVSYSEKVFNYLNENKFDLVSLLSEEDELDIPDDVFNGEEEEETSKEETSEEETSEENTESQESSDEDDSEEETKDIADEARKAREKAKAELTIARAEAIEVVEPESAERSVADFITKGALATESYYSQDNCLQKFIFENNSEEQVLDFENKISIPTLVNNTMDYIDKFDSMFDKPQYCYDVAVEQIIKYGGGDFEKLLKDFDMQFHETYGKRFPKEDESPVMSYVNNQNYKNAVDAQK